MSRSLLFPLSPPSLYLSVCVSSDICLLCSSMQLCLRLYGELEALAPVKGSGLVVLSWHGNSLG